mmetsp:Transcript_8939/g.14790  ORF Transcript_8939/g.14790 Transcript_8939/m.14790 type:complete len:82 (+) Transcript_8939:201-446(+)
MSRSQKEGRHMRSLKVGFLGKGLEQRVVPGDILTKTVQIYWFWWRMLALDMESWFILRIVGGNAEMPETSSVLPSGFGRMP